MIEKPLLEYQVAEQKRTYVLTRQTTVMGRAPDCDLVLPYPMVSRQHAQVVQEGGTFYVQDLRSANGTFVNDDSASERRVLKDGDKVRLGEFTLLFRAPVVKQVVLSDEYDMDAGMTISVPIARLAASGMLSTGPQARDPHEMVQIVFNAAKSLVGSASLGEVLEKAMNLVFEYLKPDRGLLMLYDESDSQLTPRVVKHGKRSAGGNMSFSRTIVNKVFQEGVSILTANAMHDQRFTTNESIMIQQIRSCMCVPLWDERKTIGILYVDSLIHENLFQQRDLDLMATIAVISAVAIEQYRLNDVISREKAIRGRLERYHSPSVINRIIGGGGENLLKTEEREITVLFADLVKFTTFSERMEPVEVANVLNTHFTAMTDAIFHYEGTLDKYIGDAVMAIFGAPFAQADHARRAVSAAVEMFTAMEEINAGGRLPVPLQMRIGINSGKVVAGDIGSEKRMDYTVLGSTVNIASRIESSVAKAGEIVIGERTRALIGNLFPVIPLGPISLRGLSTPMELFRVDRSRGND